MSRILSFGQDGRWRRFLVSRARAPREGVVLDVATGTGQVAIELGRRHPVRVVGLDQSAEMLDGARASIRRHRLGARIFVCLGQGERLPFGDASFDAVTFTYLLRYVEDPAATLAELSRVLRPGGTLAGLEFHVPDHWWWRGPWYAYTRVILPALGRTTSREWADTGRFLGPSISSFYERYPLSEQLAMWRAAGVSDVRARVMSMGGGVVTWGERAGAGRG
ncbi:MAG: class I SAM-dependent methyltransferase [Actinomycetota bacterium]|nr:class I SAM-dependent methyltransferase [Actinomycetota bacterium]